ncbi:MAG: hypothetical protein ACTSUE_24685 [Promethearchaeota archaeon]
MEDYRDDSFAIVRFRSNLGYLHDVHVVVSHAAYEFGRVCAWWKKDGKDWLIYYKDRVDPGVGIVITGYSSIELLTFYHCKQRH